MPSFLLMAIVISAGPVVDARTGLHFLTEPDGFTACIYFPPDRWNDDCGEAPVVPTENLQHRNLFAANFGSEQLQITLAAAGIRISRPSRMSAQEVDRFLAGVVSAMRKQLGADFEIVPRRDGSSFERRIYGGAVFVRAVVENASHDERIVLYGLPTADEMVLLTFFSPAGPRHRELEWLETQMLGRLRPPVLPESHEFAVPRDNAYEVGRACGQVTGSLCCLVAGIAAVIALYRAVRKSLRRKNPESSGAPPPPPAMP